MFRELSKVSDILLAVVAIGVLSLFGAGCNKTKASNSGNTGTLVKPTSQSAITRFYLSTPWPPGSPQECLAAQLKEGLNYSQAIDACKIDLKGFAVGTILPVGFGEFPVSVSRGSKMPTAVACVALPSDGKTPPAAGKDGGNDTKDGGSAPDELPDLPTRKDTEKMRDEAVQKEFDAYDKLKAAEKEFKAALAEEKRLSAILDRENKSPKPKPKYPQHTAQNFESMCQQFNTFIAQCEDSRWKSKECADLLNAINGCVDSDVSRVEDQTSCKPVDPGSAVAAAVIEAKCSQLKRGADGQNPCDRAVAEGFNPARFVVDRCSPSNDTRVTPDGGSDPNCPQADLEKFLQMTIRTRDFAYILSKIGGPPPPTDADFLNGGKPR